jgi:hypothetical protein
LQQYIFSRAFSLFGSNNKNLIAYGVILHQIEQNVTDLNRLFSGRPINGHDVQGFYLLVYFLRSFFLLARHIGS